MQLYNISEDNRLICHILSTLRNVYTQRNKMLFRHYVETLGIALAIEAGKSLDYNKKRITTPFSISCIEALSSNIVLFAIVRAGIKMQDGVSKVFPFAPSGFCTSVKNEKNIRVPHLFSPCETAGKVIIISEPLITSASSVLSVIDTINKNGTPNKYIILNLISTPLAIENLNRHLDKNDALYTCAIDNFSKGIKGTIPGLGDVGDLLYNENK